jgi:hypothetical protein
MAASELGWTPWTNQRTTQRSKNLSSRFKHVSRSTAHIYLYTVGEGIEYDQSVVGHRRG